MDFRVEGGGAGEACSLLPMAAPAQARHGKDRLQGVHSYLLFRRSFHFWQLNLGRTVSYVHFSNVFLLLHG